LHSYYCSPRVDFHFDRLFSRTELYVGFQPEFKITDIENNGIKPQFNFTMNRMLILGLSRDIIKDNASIYIEAYGIGVYNIGFRYIFRRKNNKPDSDSTG